MAEDKIVIIDGNSLVNRAFYAIQRPMITRDGFYTQGIYGFLSMLFKILDDYRPSHMLVAFDRKAPTFRHLEFTDYKAGRKKMPDELAMEMPVLKDVLHLLGIATYELDGFEADDIIGTTTAMAKEQGMASYVITGDRDALQLAGSGCTVIINRKGVSDFKAYDDALMMEEYGFAQSAFIDFKALYGDSSDNIPGVAGIGEKTAKMLIQRFGSVENLLANTEQIESKSVRAKVEAGAMDAMLSKRLATIVCNVPVEYSIADLLIKPVDTDGLIEMYKRLEFKTYLAKLMKQESAKAAQKASVQGQGAEAQSLAQQAAAPSSDYPAARVITDENDAYEALTAAFRSGNVTFDIVTDGSHIQAPSVDGLELLWDGGCAAICCGPAKLSALVAKALKGNRVYAKGFHLGRLYYALMANGIDCSGLIPAFDCALAQYVLHPGTRDPELNALIFEHYHETLGAEEKPAQLDLFSLADPAAQYALTGKKLTLINRLAADQAIAVEEAGLHFVFYDIELPLCPILASMEKEGFSTDREFLSSFGVSLKEQLQALEQEIYRLAGERFNINSPKQLGTVLFEKLQLPAGKKTKSGYSTSADILEKLAPDHEIVAKILEYRTYSKLNSTYVEGLMPLIAEDGRIHAHFQQTVTATGRISCTEPNLQNIPVRSDLGRQLRNAFTADAGHILIGADYSQIELRVMAHMSQDPTLIDCFNNGLDIHRETASKVFGVPQELVTSQMRSNAKAVNFGVIYGMSGFGLSQGLSITRKEAEKYIADYFDRFPRVKQFLDECIADCKQTGYATTLFGRRREVLEITAPAFLVRQLGERLAMNTPIQGTAADIIKLAMIRVYDRLAKECPGSRLILQVHDELIIHAAQSEAEKVRKLLVEEMEHAAQMTVALEVSLEEGGNWFQLK